MLKWALDVVEAAKSLRLEQKGSKTGSALASQDLANSIDNLRQALEIFDQETSQQLNAPANNFKPEFSTPPQLDEKGSIENQIKLDHSLSIDNPAPSPEEISQLEEIQENPSEKQTLIYSPRPTSRLLIPASSAVVAKEYLDTSLDLGDMEINDGAESVHDFLMSLDAISDKLEYAVARVGWTPRLRALAEAANIARARMSLDISPDDCYVRVPVDQWSNMMSAVADASLDMDNKLNIPTPKLKYSNDPTLEQEHSYALKPKYHDID